MVLRGESKFQKPLDDKRRRFCDDADEAFEKLGLFCRR